MTKLGVVPNFDDNTITIDQQRLPMRTFESISNPKQLRSQFKAFTEPILMQEATNRAVTIFDAKYKKANVLQVVHENCKHLTVSQQNHLLKLLLEFEELFNGTLGDWKTEPVKFKLKSGTAPYYGRAFPIPHIHLETLKKEVARLVKLGVLVKQPFSQWGAPTFIFPKKMAK